MRAKIDAFVKDTAQFYDITMLALQYNSEGTTDRNRTIHDTDPRTMGDLYFLYILRSKT